MGAQTHANDDAQTNDNLTPTQNRAVREVQRFEDYINDAEGDHAVQFVRDGG